MMCMLSRSTQCGKRIGMRDYGRLGGIKGGRRGEERRRKRGEEEDEEGRSKG